ncbi:hypothetical protein U1Q18_025658 [Sarracenia purpurea var. burkii]
MAAGDGLGDEDVDDLGEVQGKPEERNLGRLLAFDPIVSSDGCNEPTVNEEHELVAEGKHVGASPKVESDGESCTELTPRPPVLAKEEGDVNESKPPSGPPLTETDMTVVTESSGFNSEQGEIGESEVDSPLFKRDSASVASEGNKDGVDDSVLECKVSSVFSPPPSMASPVNTEEGILGDNKREGSIGKDEVDSDGGVSVNNDSERNLDDAVNNANGPNYETKISPLIETSRSVVSSRFDSLKLVSNLESNRKLIGDKVRDMHNAHQVVDVSRKTNLRLSKADGGVESLFQPVGREGVEGIIVASGNSGVDQAHPKLWASVLNSARLVALPKASMEICTESQGRSTVIDEVSACSLSWLSLTYWTKVLGHFLALYGFSHQVEDEVATSFWNFEFLAMFDDED